MPYSSNVAPFLGKRDGCYDVAVRMLKSGDLDFMFAHKTILKNNVLYYLKEAIKNGRRAVMLCNRTKGNELTNCSNSEHAEKFLLHIDLLLDESKTGYFALKHAKMLKSSEGFITNFYASPSKNLSDELDAYLLRSQKSVQYMLRYIELAQEKYSQLQKSDRNNFSSDELDRYMRAYNSIAVEEFDSLLEVWKKSNSKAIEFVSSANDDTDFIENS